MGIDVAGWIEVRTGGGPPGYARWEAITRIGTFVGRNRDVHAAFFFGGRPTGFFPPVAPDRGLLGDASAEVIADYKRTLPHSPEVFGWTWLTLADLEALNWDEPSSKLWLRSHRLTPDGDLSGWGAPGFSDAAYDRYRELALAVERGKLAEEGAWHVGDWVFQTEYPTRRKLLDAGWRTVFDLMEVIGRQFGSHCVRLVVWFIV